jgi:deazaflavin-dependent oxidoreductase (nitroreductase family)
MSDTDERRQLSERYRSDPLAVNRMVVERYRATGGDLGPPFGGPGRMLLLTSTGARSGRPQTSPMMYIRDGDRLVVFASDTGAPRPPSWYHNLLVHPEATVEVGDRRLSVTARVTTGEERERLWRQFPFPEHEEQAGRQIPVVALEPHSRQNV